MKRSAGRLAVLLSSASSAAILACGLADLGTVPPGEEDAGTRMDAFVPAAVDAGVPLANDASPSSGAPDAKADAPKQAATDASPDDAGLDAPGDAHPDTAPPDAGITFTCSSGAPTKDCTSCTGDPLECVMCATDGSGGIFATCVPPGSSCRASYTPSGYDFCKCAPPSAAACPLPQQECNSYNNGVCVTCGEKWTDGFACKSIGTCHENSSSCY